MTLMTQRCLVGRVVAAAQIILVCFFCLTGFLTGCDDPLEVSDPTAIEDGDLNSARGAEQLRNAAIGQFAATLTRNALLGGLMTDELFYNAHPSVVQLGGALPELMADKRVVSQPWVADYSFWQEARRGIAVAIPRLRAYAPPAAAPAWIAEMLALRGYTAVHMAESLCPGFPLHEIVDLKPVYGRPLSTEEVFEHALADFDSAIANAADSARVLNLVRIGRGRALLGLARFADAAATVADVPTGYVANQEYSAATSRNLLVIAAVPTPQRSVADREGINGLDFVSAADPRVRTTHVGTAYDGVSGLYAANKYSNVSAPIVLASGIEARLIEAEAALRVGSASWLTILNGLRSTQIVPPLMALTDPGNDDARVNLLFRERAFWLFATGHRVGDLRRLVQHYNRAAGAVFPTGNYRAPAGGAFENATNLPLSPTELEQERLYSPTVSGCTSR